MLFWIDISLEEGSDSDRTSVSKKYFQYAVLNGRKLDYLTI